MTKKGINFTQLQANTNWAFALMEMVVKNKLAEVRKDNDSMIEKEAENSYMKEVLEENKRLKAQLYCENEDGVCLICNNHYLVKGKTYDKYYISKCKKGHDECSTEVLRYCKDFELKDD